MTSEELELRLVEDFSATLDILTGLIRQTERFHEGSHSNFVAEKAERVGRFLELDESSLFEIRVAGLLHDIGKIGFPESILEHSAGELSHGDMKFYQAHPEIGADLVARHSGLESVSHIIRYHHERFDGTGFPARLKGNDIPLQSQILAVVDFYHNAMFRLGRDKAYTIKSSTSVAGVRSTLAPDQARFSQTIAALQARAGSQFSRQVVDAFIGVIEADRRREGSMSMYKLAINQLKDGMAFAEDYYTSFGLLIAAKGEPIKENMIPALLKFVDSGELPAKILVVK